MRILPVHLPPVHENQSQWETSSQDTRIEGFINSDAPFNLHAARLEREMQTAQINQTTRQERIQQPQQRPAVKIWKNFCHNAAMLCGALFLPSFACLAFGVIGLCVPAALFVAGVILYCLGGKPTPETMAANEARAIQNAMYDPR